MTIHERIQEIERRHAAVATAWSPNDCELTYDKEDGYAPQGATLGDTMITLGDTYEGSGSDWSFVAHAYQDIQFLLDVIEGLTSMIKHD